MQYTKEKQLGRKIKKDIGYSKKWQISKRVINKEIIKRLDIKFAIYIKLLCNLQCKYCGKLYPIKDGKIPQGLHVAHIKSRRCFTIRWDDRNAIALCYGHHQMFHGEPYKFIEWLKKENIHTEESLITLEHRAQQGFDKRYELIEIWLDKMLNVQLIHYDKLNYPELTEIYRHIDEMKEALKREALKGVRQSN